MHLYERLSRFSQSNSQNSLDTHVQSSPFIGQQMGSYEVFFAAPPYMDLRKVLGLYLF